MNINGMPPWAWIVFYALVLIMLVADLKMFGRDPFIVFTSNIFAILGLFRTGCCGQIFHLLEVRSWHHPHLCRSKDATGHERVSQQPCSSDGLPPECASHRSSHISQPGSNLWCPLIVNVVFRSGNAQ